MKSAATTGPRMNPLMPSMLGINGFILGPVVAALFMAGWENFRPSKDKE